MAAMALIAAQILALRASGGMQTFLSGLIFASYSIGEVRKTG